MTSPRSQFDESVASRYDSVSDSSIEVGVDLRPARARSSSFRRWLARQLASPQVYVVPLRIFIGVGWLRAAAEKLGDAAWYDGTALRSFLDAKVAADAIALGSYGWLVEHLWYPTATPLGWLVMVAQLVVGASILLGAFTNAALLIGIFLNLNFMLAGAISPSAFYIVIQIVLFAIGAGAVFGLDQRWQDSARSVLLVARQDTLAIGRTDRWSIAFLASAFLAIAVAAAVRATDFSPSGVEDPALVLAVVMVVCAVTLAVALARDLIRHGTQRPQ